MLDKTHVLPMGYSCTKNEIIAVKIVDANSSTDGRTKYTHSPPTIDRSPSIQ